MRRRLRVPSSAHLAALLTAAVLVVAVLSGCAQIRLEQSEANAPPTDAVEQLRQRAALESAELVDLAAQASADEPDEAIATQLAAVGQAARTQLDALGGVWVPTGRHLRPITRPGDGSAVVALLTSSAAAARTAASELNGDAARLQAAIAVSRSLAATQLTAALGQPAADALPLELPATLDGDTADELIRTYDALGWLNEIVAARADGDARTAAAAAATTWRATADSVAAAAGVAGTEADPREVTYDLDLTDLAATISALQAELLPRWLAQLATTTGEDRGAVIDQAIAAGVAAGLAVPGAAVPPLPGLST